MMIKKFIKDGLFAFLPPLGTITDLSKKGVALTHSGVVHRKTTSRNTLFYPLSSYTVSTSNNPFATADFANGLTMAVLVRPTVDSGLYILDIEGAIYIRIDAATGKFYCNVDGGAPSNSTTSDSTGKLTTVVATFNTSTNKLYVYVNGVLEVNGASTTLYNIDSLNRAFGVGCNYLGANPFNSSLGAALIGGFYTNSTEAGRLHNELINLVNSGAQAKRTGTYDFVSFQPINVSFAEEGGTEGFYLSNSPFRFGDATGRFKISTATFKGSLVKVIECTTGGTIIIDQYNDDWYGWLKKSAESDYTKQSLTTASITSGTTTTIFTFSAGDKLILSSLGGDYLLTNDL